jgi:hypothetical protein
VRRRRRRRRRKKRGVHREGKEVLRLREVQ